MIDPHDYSKTIFSQGVICYNTNNHNYCIVINGTNGREDDRCSLVMELCGSEGFMLHTPPNRALVPTGKTINLKYLARALRKNVAEEFETK
jgi:hypothetical protein